MKSSHALPPDEALVLIARHFAALGDPLRLKIVHALIAGEKNVGELVRVTGGLQANISRHLHKLVSAGVLVRRKQGNQAFYAIADPSIYGLCELVCGSLEQRLAKLTKAIKVTAKRR
ncbi:MAG: metalloregulator ArsR/SmtB family transcription factor [Lacunisphaera sp.]|nr:metalloregulator ArsR/SmtB family transcription factor [Lacunisphaera sp.]